MTQDQSISNTQGPDTASSAILWQPDTAETAPDSLEEIIGSPPPHWFRFAYWFRVGLAFFVLLSVALGMTACQATATSVPWQPATKVLDRGVVEAMVQHDTMLPKAIADKTLAWPLKQDDGTLVVINYNNSGVCGRLGCLYGAFLRQDAGPWQPVFSSYLDPNLPPDIPLFTPVRREERRFPCLQVNQTGQSGASQGVRQTVYCYNGKTYQSVSSDLHSLEHKGQTSSH